MSDIYDNMLAERQRARQAQPQKDQLVYPGGNIYDDMLAKKNKNSQAQQPPPITQGEAAIEGAKSGASAGWSDEMLGLSRASGLPDWLGGFRAPVGAGMLAAEKMTAPGPIKGENVMDVDPNQFTPTPGPVEQSYNTARDEGRQRQEAARNEYPGTYYGSEFAGSLATPTGKLKAVSGLGRVAESAGKGAAYGAISGAGEAQSPQSTGTQAVAGGIAGGLFGGAAPAIIEGPGQAWRYGSAPFRGGVDTESEALRRYGTALREGMPREWHGWTPEDQQRALQMFGQPMANIDVGGEPVRALARSAANTSAVARQTLADTLEPRAGEQKQRFMDFIGMFTGGLNADQARQTLQAGQRVRNPAAYRTAYDAGDYPITSPTLNRLTTSEEVQSAMRVAERKWGDWQVIDGYGALRAPVLLDTNENALRWIRRDGQGLGMPTFPNIQYWDYTARELAGRAQAARNAGGAGNTEAARIGGLEQLIKGELDRIVPRYGEARAGARGFFGGHDALDDGALFATRHYDINEARRAYRDMTPAERQLFSVGYVSRVIDDVRESTTASVPRRYDVTKNIGQDERAQLALGAFNAQRLEIFMRFENIMKMSENAVKGNSSTARQLIEAGMAGGAAGSALDVYTGEMSPRDVAIGALTFGGARGLHMAANQRVVQRVAEMLTSNDPALIKRALAMTTAYPWLNQTFQRAEAHLARALSTQVQKPDLSSQP